MHGYTLDKDDYRNRMHRIEGQVRGIERMIEEDVYCIDILTQIAAVTRTLQKVALGIVSEHLNHCVRGAIETDPEEGTAKIEEAVAAVERLVRT